MNKLVVSLFGGCRFSLDGTPVALRNNKADALLAFLLVTSPRPHKRETLMTLLWPDTMRKSAQNNLRQTLHRIRQTIPAVSAQDNASTVPLLFSTRQTVQIHPEASIVVDATQFSQINKTQTVESLTEAVQLYKGAFLNNFFVPDSNEFESWAATLRAQFQIQALNALDFLAQHHLHNGRYDLAQAFARQQLVIDSFRETAVCQLMTILAKSGQRIEALEAYETFRQLLADELGVDPSAETTALFQQIQNDELRVDAIQKSEMPLGGTSTGEETLTAVFTPPPTAIPFHAPLLSPYFVGRESEFRQVQQITQATEHQAQRIAIIGMGGIGKTTFAAFLAHQLKEQFSDGVLWANNKTSDVFNSLELWARTFGYNFSGITDLSSKAIAVHDMLAEKQLLVVIDNVDDAALARPLLPYGERTVTLITTRNLDIAIALNATPIRLTELEPAVSQRLLREILGGERVSASADETAAAAQIGRLLHHLPLAVEIAAKLVSSRPRMRLGGMARRLEDMQQRLGLRIGDQAVRASFQISWEGLSSANKIIFSAMGNFAGRPFLPEALAATISQNIYDTEDALFTLSTLSLVSEDGERRYRQHPLLADFAAEKLAESPDKRKKQENHLIDYYLAFIQSIGKNYDQLEAEWEQITAVIQLSHQRQNWSQLLTIVNNLVEAWNTTARYTHATQAYALALEAAQALGDAEQESLILLRWGQASLELNHYESAETQLTNSLQRYYRLEEEDGMVQTQYHLARIAIEQGQYDKASKWLNTCKAILEIATDQQGLGDVLFHQALIAFADGFRLDDAAAFASEALKFHEMTNNQTGKMAVLRMQSDIATKRGNFKQAEQLALEAKSLSEQLFDQTELASSLFSLTTIYLRQGKLEQAKTAAEQSLTILKRNGIKRVEGLVMRNLGSIHKQLGNYEEALIFFQKSLAIFQKLNLKLSQAFSFYGLAQLYELLHQPNSAAQASQAAHQLAVELHHQPLLDRLQSNFQLPPLRPKS